MGYVEEASAATRAVVLVQSDFLTQSSEGWTPRHFQLLREKCTGSDAATLGARSASNLLNEPTLAKLATLRSAIRGSLGLASDAAVDFIYNTAGLDDCNATSLNVAAQRGAREHVEDAAFAAATIVVGDEGEEIRINDGDDVDTQLDQENADEDDEDDEDDEIVVCTACEWPECHRLMLRAQRGATGIDLVCCKCDRMVPECRACLGLSDSDSDSSDPGPGDAVCERCEGHACVIVAEGEGSHCCVCNGGNAASCCRPCQHTRYRLHGPHF